MLTKREEAVMDFLVKNPDYRACADELCISYATVKTHVTRLLRKYSVHSLAELIILFYTNIMDDRYARLLEENKRLQAQNRELQSELMPLREKCFKGLNTVKIAEIIKTVLRRLGKV